MKVLPKSQAGARVVSTLCALLLLFFGRQALGGDQEPVFFGGDAMVSAGALSAWTDGAAAIFYNPAGLGLVQRDRVSISGTNFMVRIRERPGMLQADLPQGIVDADGGHVSFSVVPFGIGYAHSLSERLTIGGIAYLRERDRLEIDSTLTLDPGDFVESLEAASSFLGLQVQRWRVNIGFALGWQVRDVFRLGIGLFGDIAIGRTNVTLQHDVEPELGTGPHVALTHRSTALRGFATFGLQWDFAPGWHLGVVWRSSVVGLVRSDRVSSASEADFRALESVVGAVALHRFERPPGSFELAAPSLLKVAFAYTSSLGWIGVEGEVAPPLRDAARHRDEGLGWNVRVGGRIALGGRLHLGAGLFTLRSSLDSPDGLVEPAMDYYGATLGLQIRRAYSVGNSDDPEGLVFVTTLAARYAFGVGQVQGVLYDPFAAEVSYQSGQIREVMNHDISWFMGSSILF